MDGFAAKPHFARVGLEQTGQHRDQRGLAASGEANDGDELALVDGQINAAQHLGDLAAKPVAFANSCKFEKGHRQYLKAWRRS